MGDGLRACGEHPGAIARGGVLLGGLPVVPGALEMVGDDRRIRVQRLERFGDAAVQQPPPRQADAGLRDRSQTLVAEVVSVVVLGDQPARRQLLERACDLFLGPPADDAQRLGIEAAADQRRCAEDLGRGLADCSEAPLEHGAHTPRGAAAGGEKLRDQQRQPLALAVHVGPGRLVEARAGGEAEHVVAGQPPEPDALAELGEPGAAPVGVGLVGPSRRQQQDAALQQAPAEVAERVERCGIAPVEVVDEDNTGRAAERVGDQPADRLEKVLARPRLVQAGRGSGPQIGEQAGRVAAQRLRDRIGADRGAQELGDHAVGEAPLAGVRTSPQHSRPTAGQCVDRLLGQPGLADARLALDHDDRPVLGDLAEGVDDAAQLGAAADQRQLVRLRDRLGDHRLQLGPRADRAVQLGRLGERLDAELAAQHPHAVAVLGERVAATARRGVELDQLAVRRLVQPVEVEPLPGTRDRLVEAALACEQVDQPVERGGPFAADGVLSESLPVVEVDAVAQAEAREQVVAVEVAGRDQRRDRRVRVGHQEPELCEVEPHVGEVDAHRVSIAAQPSRTERRA